MDHTSFRHRLANTLGFALALGVVGAAMVGPVAAPAVATPATAAAPALVRSGHFSPDVAAVDVYLTAFGGGSTALWISDEAYGEVSGYRQVAAGVYVVSMRPHGAAADSPASITWTVDAAPGRAYTAAAVGSASALQARILSDDTSAPPRGEGRVRVIQAASLAPTATITANGGVTVADAVPFGTTTGYRSVAAGTWDLRAVAPAPGLVASGAVSVPAGTASTVVLLDTTAGGLTLRTVVDSAGSAVVPVGSVDAGGGGTAVARSSGTTHAPLPAVVVLGSVAIAVLVLVGRRGLRRAG
ncbi:DUF4397 domain-containing protein [Jatrophihabitans sp. YIM 134969]